MGDGLHSGKFGMQRRVIKRRLCCPSCRDWDVFSAEKPCSKGMIRMDREREDVFYGWEPTQRQFGYTQAIRAGNTVYVSGTASLDENFALLHPGDLPAQMQLI